MHALNLTAIAALSAGLVSLSGCSSKTGADPYNLDWSEDTKGVTISFWTPFGSDIEDSLESIVKTFEDETGINVTCEAKGGYDNLESAVILSASTNTMPEVTLAYPDHEANYLDINALVKLDYYFENDGDSDFQISDFYSDYMKENQSLAYKNDGTPYTTGIPFNKSTEVLCYNSTFFDWAKTRDSSIVPPTTWDDVTALGPKIDAVLTPYFGKIIGSDNNAYASESAMPSGVTVVLDFTSVAHDDFHPLSYDSQSNFFITTCRQWGGQYTTVDKSTGKGYLAFNSDQVKTGLQFMKAAATDDSVAIPATFGEAKYTSNEFKLLQSVMVISSSAGVGNQAPAGNMFQVGVSPIPYENAADKYVISQGTNLVLLDQGTNAQHLAAWKLIKYLAKAANGLFAAESGYYPSCAYATSSADYQEFVNRAPVSIADKIAYQTVKVNSDYYMNSASNWIKFVDPGFVGSSSVRTSVSTVMARLFVDGLTPQAAIDEQYASLKDYVK